MSAEAECVKAEEHSGAGLDPLPGGVRPVLRIAPPPRGITGPGGALDPPKRHRTVWRAGRILCAASRRPPSRRLGTGSVRRREAPEQAFRAAAQHGPQRSGPGPGPGHPR